MTYRLQWLTSFHDTHFPTADYVSLYQYLPHATPYNHLAWLTAAEDALTADTQLAILLIWQTTQLVGCLPLIRRREQQKGLHFMVVRHLGFPMSDRIGLMLKEEAAEAAPLILTAIQQHLPYALLQLNEVTAESGEAVFRQWGQCSCYWEQRLICHAPEHAITAADREEISGDARYKLRRARKRTAALGAEIICLQPDEHSIDSILEQISQVELASWKGTEEVGVFCSDHAQWMKQAFRQLAKAGLVSVIALQHEGRYISYRIGPLDKGRIYDFNLAFHPDHAALGSGRLLLDEWIRWGLEQGVQWLDASRVSMKSNHQLHERMTNTITHYRWSFYSYRPAGIVLSLMYRLWNTYKQRKQPSTQSGSIDAH
ncbi:hypothetical protein WH50_02155 [Pokkaliibacter plantistimulans]|uniref:BioF2-like acetyltransferase domain-containing protein n=1 Tax=Pokkaliibacter plantistimulans TaxID=1635171 RepID=A0ABX5M1R4_9GAMM|nr:GNAT family N-acetyltransferase [Pokkaliibacter plantistimulans]PXF32854.1 hypothetical protein WH50_02155 [Pokkaliibacter plantistimulans]